MMPKCHRWHTITELRWCRKRHRWHSITKPRCCQNVTGHRNTRFQTLSNPTRVTEFSPVKVELVKMRTILELREGRSWRDPESTFWNFCCSSSSTVDPSVSVATPLTDALSGVSDILAMKPHTHTPFFTGRGKSSSVLESVSVSGLCRSRRDLKPSPDDLTR